MNFHSANIIVEVGRARAWVGNRCVELSASEIVLLGRLYKARGHLVPASLLEDALYEDTYGDREISEVKYHIRNLRRKLGDHDRTLIFCRRRLGYGLEVERICWRE